MSADKKSLTTRESQIMAVLWDRGEASADEVRHALADELHDSTVRTMLRVLESKGYVRHAKRGKAFVYRPAMRQAKAQRQALLRLVKQFFGGSPEALVLRLLEDEQITPEQLAELRRVDKEKR
jgi:BlaI family transcriptional regulator, penicillinase repressor